MMRAKVLAGVAVSGMMMASEMGCRQAPPQAPTVVVEHTNDEDRDRGQQDPQQQDRQRQSQQLQDRQQTYQQQQQDQQQQQQFQRNQNQQDPNRRNYPQQPQQQPRQLQ